MLRRGIDLITMVALLMLRRWPRVASAYVLTLLGAYVWWILQSPHTRLSVLAASSTDLAHLERVPWLVIPASSIWPGDMFGYWAVVVLLCVGALERLRGGLVALATGAVAHVVGTGVSEGVTAARIAAGNLSASAKHLLDVGPSYAVAACAAAVVFSPNANRWLRGACALTLLPLVITAFDSSDESQVAAIGHAVAMLTGIVVARWQRRRTTLALTPAVA
ncbi:MAG TPA: rhomboid-like protein [Mycobacteriales bacterium]|nr:rhomboid-like protein [Mycobacteriales bacterium]